jgi:predicted transcriptional regulator
MAALNLRLSSDRRRDLDLLIEDTGWSRNKVINRAVRDILVLHYIHRKKAEQAGGAHGELLLRVVRDFGAAMLIDRTLGYGQDRETGEPLISATARDTHEKALFYEDDRGQLLVQRTTADGVVSHYVCRDGELQLLDEYLAPGSPVLN